MPLLGQHAAGGLQMGGKDRGAARSVTCGMQVARPVLGLGPSGPALAPSKIAPGDFLRGPSWASALRARRWRRQTSLQAIFCEAASLFGRRAHGTLGHKLRMMSGR